MFIDVLILWLVNLFCKSSKSSKSGKQSKGNKNEDLTAFFFGTHHLEDQHKSEPVNKDWDNGPDW